MASGLAADPLAELRSRVRDLEAMLTILVQRNRGVIEISEHDLVGVELNQLTVHQRRVGLARVFTIESSVPVRE